MTHKFSVVMPIHNEQTFLPYSLPSIFQLAPKEIILLFDRCTDDSKLVAKELVNRLNYTANIRFVDVNEDLKWNCRHAYVRRLGYNLAENDIILSTDADIILDTHIADYLPLIGTTSKLIVFERIDYPITYQNTVMRLFQRVLKNRLYQKFTGIYAFSREAWLETEDLEDAKTIERSEDAHLQLAIAKKYHSHFVLTKSVHLRPRETKQTHYRTGRLYWKIARRNLPLTIITGLILLRPTQIRGYIHERFSD